MNTEFMTIKTQRLVLRKIVASDLDHIFEGLSHPEVIKYYGISFATKESAKEQMKWFSDHEKNETGIWWAVCSNDNGEFFGAGGLNDINKEHRKAEIGFWLLPEYWNKGFMTEAMPEIINYGFEKLDLHRIEGFVESENTNCKKVLDKLSFTYEGTMRDAELKNGKYISIDIYAKLNTPSDL
ncbi:MAG TPA: GNAT family protein [Gracilimonas sp.]|nr:GNAT family protein [Gracilimonas sp.]